MSAYKFSEAVKAEISAAQWGNTRGGKAALKAFGAGCAAGVIIYAIVIMIAYAAAAWVCGK